MYSRTSLIWTCTSAVWTAQINHVVCSLLLPIGSNDVWLDKRDMSKRWNGLENGLTNGLADTSFNIPFQYTYSTQYRPYTSLRTWLQSFLEAI